MDKKKMSDDDLLKVLFEINWSDSEDDFIESEDENEQDVHCSGNIGIPTNNIEGKTPYTIT